VLRTAWHATQGLTATHITLAFAASSISAPAQAAIPPVTAVLSALRRTSFESTQLEHPWDVDRAQHPRHQSVFSGNNAAAISGGAAIWQPVLGADPIAPVQGTRSSIIVAAIGVRSGCGGGVNVGIGIFDPSEEYARKQVCKTCCVSVLHSS
jgi:hypothetical protein